MILRHPSISLDDELQSRVEKYPDCSTMTELFRASCTANAGRVLYRYRKVILEEESRDMRQKKTLITKLHGEPETLTYDEVYEMVISLSASLKNFDEDSEVTRIGVYMDSCIEWLVSFQAIQRIGKAAVTVYRTLGFDALRSCLNESELSCLIVDFDNLANIDRELGFGQVPTLRRLLVCHCRGRAPNSHCFETRDFYEMLCEGSLATQGEEEEEGEDAGTTLEPGPDDLSVIMYTSGTTGTPKGVMMLHRQLVAAVSGIRTASGCCSDDVYLSYLPFAHVYELVVHHVAIVGGAVIGMGSPRTLLAKPGGAKVMGDLEFVKPTLFVGVPRVWEAIKKGILGKVRTAGGAKAWLFETMLEWTVDGMREAKSREIAYWGSGFLFGRIRDVFGGRLRSIMSGGAPLSSETHRFLQATLGSEVPIGQGYALTETCCNGTGQDPDDPYFETMTCGPPLTTVEIKLIDVPEMNYFAENNEGEVCLRGPCIAQGYFKKPELTREAFDEDGWFHSGDVGRFVDRDGVPYSLAIIDRIKQLVKVASGEYVALEQCEMQYSGSSFVSPSGLMLYVDSFSNFLVGIVVPDPVYAKLWATEMGLTVTEVPDIVALPQFKAALLADFSRIAERENYPRFQRCQDVTITLDEWTPQNLMLTASAKFQRRNIVQRYKAAIDAMLERGGGEEEVAVDTPFVGRGTVPQFFDAIE